MSSAASTCCLAELGFEGRSPGGERVVGRLRGCLGWLSGGVGAGMAGAYQPGVGCMLTVIAWEPPERGSLSLRATV